MKYGILYSMMKSYAELQELGNVMESVGINLEPEIFNGHFYQCFDEISDTIKAYCNITNVSDEIGNLIHTTNLENFEEHTNKLWEIYGVRD